MMPMKDHIGHTVLVELLRGSVKIFNMILCSMISPVNKNRFALVPGVRHLHPSHHQAVHAATLTVQVHLGNIGLLLGYEL